MHKLNSTSILHLLPARCLPLLHRSVWWLARCSSLPIVVLRLCLPALCCVVFVLIGYPEAERNAQDGIRGRCRAPQPYVRVYGWRAVALEHAASYRHFRIMRTFLRKAPITFQKLSRKKRTMIQYHQTSM